MRAMWSAASGMKGLQLQIDTISNNLSNVNTTGFKSQRMEFKDLLYKQIASADVIEGEGRPVPTEIGHGVMPVATLRDFSMGNMQQTEGNFDFAVNGDGFFVVRNAQNELRYTKDGSFKVSAEDGNIRLVTSDGFYLQGPDGDLNLGENVVEFAVGQDGSMKVKREGSDAYEDLGQFTLAKFINPAGLKSLGRNLYEATSASGVAITEFENDRPEVWQGYLETSNVQVVDEMINLITAQRAYEVNSKSIQTADRMLEVANNLKR